MSESTTHKPTRGVPITIAGRERCLRYSLKTIEEVQEKLGEDAIEKGVPVAKLAQLLWYGLKAEDPELSLDQIKDDVDLEHLHELMPAILQATGQRARVVKGDEEENKGEENKGEAEVP